MFKTHANFNHLCALLVYSTISIMGAQLQLLISLKMHALTYQ